VSRRGYLVSASIRLFIFDNRIETISPGHLPNNLTIERIQAGISNIRNPILVSYVAKGMLPYRGLGSGIKRALADWPSISFTDDQEGCLFTATVHRQIEERMEKTSEKITQLPETSEKRGGSPISSPKGSPKTAIERLIATASCSFENTLFGFSSECVVCCHSAS